MQKLRFQRDSDPKTFWSPRTVSIMSAKQRNKPSGMWDTRTPAYSKETQELMKVMMKESKLNNFQTRQLQKTVSEGGALPLGCHPTTSAKPVIPAPPKKKIVAPSHAMGLRSKEVIEDSGAYEREKYRGGVTKSLDKEKERLAHYMAYGEDVPVITKERREELLRTPEPEPKIDRFADLEAEIQERVDFLADMRKLGKEQQYKTIINTEISQRVREMEVIDKQRTQKLKQAIEAKERQLTGS